MRCGRWTVVAGTVNTADRTVGAQDNQRGISRGGLVVPTYLPMPEPGSIVTVDEDAGSIIAILSFPSQHEFDGEMCDFPQVQEGDYLNAIPGRGYIGLLKSGVLALGHALGRCSMQMGKSGMEFVADRFHIRGTAIDAVLKAGSRTDDSGKPEFTLSMPGVIALELRDTGCTLSLMDDFLSAELNGRQLSIKLREASGELVTLFEEHFTNDNNSSKLGKKIKTILSQLTLNLNQGAYVSAQDAVNVSAPNVEVLSQNFLQLRGANANITGDKSVGIKGSKIEITGMGSAGTATTVSINNGTDGASLVMNQNGDIALGASLLGGKIYLGGQGDCMASGTHTYLAIDRLCMTLFSMISTLSAFPPTSGVTSASLPLAEAVAQAEMIKHEGISTSPAPVGPNMPNHIIF